MIRYLHHHEIDKNKWDRCIDSSPNGLVYACSWFLDIVSPGWEALVEDDYIRCMPLTCKKKFLINYIIQPAFAKQLGIFGRLNSDKEITGVFLKSIPLQYKYVDINLNSSNILPDDLKNIKSLINQVLPLSESYDEISKKFDHKTLKNIRRSIKYNVIVNSDYSFNDFLEFKKIESSRYMDFIHSEVLKKLLYRLNENVNSIIYVARNKFDNSVLASLIGIIYHSRITFLISANSLEGKDKNAMYAIFNKCIDDFSGKSYILDFAGSSIKGVNYFNEGFGAHTEHCYNIKLNNLPWYLKFFKK